MLVSFFSHENGYPGYYALVHENPHYCEQWLDWEARTIRSPTFPNKKTKSRNCVWLLRANEGYTIRINVKHFQVRYNNYFDSYIVFYFDEFTDFETF